jgi:hypothetical protein
LHISKEPLRRGNIYERHVARRRSCRW